MKTGCVITTYNEGTTGWQPEALQKYYDQGKRHSVLHPERGWIEPTPRDGYWMDDLAKKYRGNEVRATIHSIRENTRGPVQFVVVDDGSTDGSCDGLRSEGVVVVRHDQRIGIAPSRNDGFDAMDSDVDVVCFWDAHMRVTPGLVDECSRLARENDAIVWPSIRGIRDKYACRSCGRHHFGGHPGKCKACGSKRIKLFQLYGAQASTHEPGGNEIERGRRWMGATWIHSPPRDPVARCTALRVPGYHMSRSVFERARYSSLMRKWGCGEAALWAAAWFQEIDVLMPHRDREGRMVMARHFFRAHQPNYPLRHGDNLHNQAVNCRKLFDKSTWDAYWWPHVFMGGKHRRHFSKETVDAMDSPAMIAEHEEFQARKKRPDLGFWRGCCGEETPEPLA